MIKIFSALIDSFGIIFALLVYTELICLKRENKLYKTVMYLSCIVILGIFITATFGFNVPSVLASFLFMTLPSLTVFVLISKFKGTRFFVTYFFVASLALILTFIARVPAIYFGKAGAAIGLAFIVISSALIFLKTKPFYKNYRTIIDNIKCG